MEDKNRIPNKGINWFPGHNDWWLEGKISRVDTRVRI